MKRQTLFVLLLSLIFALLINLIDQRATEVQATLMVLLPLCFLLGLLHPRRAWLWALIIGLSLPFTALLSLATGWFPLQEIPTPPYAALIALIPAFIGVYAGVLAHMLLKSATGVSQSSA